MNAPLVVGFFDGSYINPAVLAEADLAPGRVEVARLPGWAIEIRPLANLVRSERDVAYGVLATATHDELDRLYTHARVVLGGVYRPHPVLACTLDGRHEPALCYIAADLALAPASAAYVARIVEPARRYGFPDWYVAHLESFAPA